MQSIDTWGLPNGLPCGYQLLLSRLSDGQRKQLRTLFEELGLELSGENYHRLLRALVLREETERDGAGRWRYAGCDDSKLVPKRLLALEGGGNESKRRVAISRRRVRRIVENLPYIE